MFTIGPEKRHEKQTNLVGAVQQQDPLCRAGPGAKIRIDKEQRKINTHCDLLIPSNKLYCSSGGRRFGAAGTAKLLFSFRISPRDRRKRFKRRMSERGLSDKTLGSWTRDKRTGPEIRLSVQIQTLKTTHAMSTAFIPLLIVTAISVTIT
ncbi:hypothetical protein EVAR_38143_1 [Eumeta japonica]|uniref:Uncharacterized protein n=1 Tax=Eumeta variegata TaxID=151549 RepID=A0A4C1YSM0_EUMVA|nr:hypothetical protein EVAR_38143_1 [Eumeta japonica]